MATIVTRAGKGSPLTNNEVDQNFINLNTDKLEGTVAIASGGTGQITQQLAINALAGAVTTGQYLRGNGTNVIMSAIQAADVPTLNQNTTGTAANVTGTVAIANGGTGSNLADPNADRILFWDDSAGVVTWLTVSTGLLITDTTLSNSGVTAYPGSGIAVSTGSAWGTSITAPTGALVGTTDTQTLTNKRVTTRIGTVASGTPITPTADASDQYNVTALATAATIAAPSGTPTDGQKLVLRIKDNGTARALTWTTTSGAYRAVGVTLPTTTVISKAVYIGCIYNAQDTFWDVVAVAQQA